MSSSPEEHVVAPAAVPATSRALPSGRRVFWWAFAVLMLLTTTWSLASPIAAGPDENAHIVKAASVVRGDLRGTSTPDNPGAGVVTVPELYASTLAYPVCFAFRGEVSASCVPALPDGAAAAAPAQARTWVIRNNPAYYAIVGLPTLLPPGAYVLYLMRLVSAALSCLVLAWGVRSIAELTRRPMVVLGFVAAITPMVVFLNSTVNPSSLEISAALTLWVALMTLIRSPDPTKITSRAAGIAVVTVILANSRGLSPLFIAVIVVCAAIVGPWRAFVTVLADRRTWPWLGVIVVGTGAALAWTRSASALGAGGSAHPELGFLSTANRTFFDTGDFLLTSIGKFGWLDTTLPTLVVVVLVALIGLPTLLALSLGSRWDRFATLAVVAAVVGVPVLVQAWQARNVGYIWTARYSMPLTVGVVVVAGYVCRDALAGLPGWVADRLMVTVTSLLAGGQLIAFAFNLRRYVVGDQGSWRHLFDGPWSPPVPVAVLILLHAVGLAAAVVLLVRFSRADDSEVTSDAHTEVAASR